MEPEDRRRLELNSQYLQRNLTDVSDIVTHLVQHGGLDLGDCSAHNIFHNNAQEVANLLRTLYDNKGSYKVFVQVLTDLQLDWIVDKLENTDIGDYVTRQESTDPESTSGNVSHSESRDQLFYHKGKATYYPMRNDNFTGRTKDLEELYRILHPPATKNRNEESKKQHASNFQLLRIHGLGGVGKSQIASEYAHRHQGEYQLIRWLRSGKHSIKKSIVKFAKDLNIAVENVDDAELVCRISKALCQYDTWLLIYDYAGSDDDIKPYLPDTNHLKEGQHIIITSLSPLGASSPSYEVRVFSNKDARAYISERLRTENHMDYNNEKSIKGLYSLLGNLPLALSQGVAYIRFHLCSIDDYLESYQRNYSRMMDNNITFENHAKKSVFVTLITSVEAILGKINPLDKPAVGKKQNPATLLKCISFLDCEEIPVSLFRKSKLFSTPEEFDEAIGELRKYSLISRCRPSCFRIHKLVQIVVREYKLQDPNLTSDPRDDFCQYALQPLTAALIEKLPKDCSCIGWRDVDGKVLVLLSNLLPHALTLLHHAENAIGSNKEPASEATRSTILHSRYDLLYFIGFAGYFLRDVATAGRAFNDLVQICSKGNTERLQLPEALEMLGICDRLSQNHGNSITNLKKALALTEPLVENERLRITIMTALGKTYYMKGDYHASREILQEALELQKQYRPNDSCLLSYILPKLGNALYGMHEFQKAREYFEQCLKVRDHLYRDDHVMLGACRFCIGKVQLCSHDFLEAEENFKFSLSCAEKHYGPKHSYFGKMNAALGLCFLLQQKYNNACEYLLAADHILEQNYGTSSEIHSRVQRWFKYAQDKKKISFDQIQMLFILDF